MDRRDVDVVVVGLGAMGAAVAWGAAARGLSVVGLDAARPPHSLGSTHGHSRIIREAYFEHPQYVPLVQRAYALWAALEAESRARLFQACGGLMVGRPDRLLVSGTRRAAAEHRLPVETWSAADLKRRVPVLAAADDMVAVFEPRAGVLAPERAVSAMLEVARHSGARLFTDEAVYGWEGRPGGVEVQTAARRIVARHVVLAAGPWLPGLLDGLALPLGVERVVQYWYPPAGDDRFAPARLPVFLLEALDGRMLYGLPDQGHGVKIAEHHGGRLTTIDAVDRTVTTEERRRFHAFAAQWVRDLPGEPAEASVCVYTNTPDSDFILDWHPDAERVYICSACSGHGFKFAPAIGEAIAAVLAGAPSPFDLTPFRLSRFAGRA